MTRIFSTEELEQLQNSGTEFTFLNVLSAGEYAKEHIPGSASAPIAGDDFLERVEAQTGGDKQKTIVVYCAGRACDASSRAARTLTSAGYADVVEYIGGMHDWKARLEQERYAPRPSKEAMAAIAAAMRREDTNAGLGQLNLEFGAQPIRKTG